MATNDDSDTPRRLALLVDRLEAVEHQRLVMAQIDSVYQRQAIVVVAFVLLVVGSLIVFIITGRVILVLLVAFICMTGVSIAQIAVISSKKSTKDF